LARESSLLGFPLMARPEPSGSVTSVGYQRPPPSQDPGCGVMSAIFVHPDPALKIHAAFKPKNGSKTSVPPATSTLPSSSKQCPQQNTSDVGDDSVPTENVEQSNMRV